MTRMMRNGRHVIGQVLIWALWTVIVAGVLLSPVFAVFVVWFIGWSFYRWLWPRSDVAPRSAPAPARPMDNLHRVGGAARSG